MRILRQHGNSKTVFILQLNRIESNRTESNQIKSSVTTNRSGHHGWMSHVFGCRVAVGGKLWGPALLLARHCSEKAFLETAAAMAEGSTTMGSPLHTLTLLMSGKADAVHAVPAVPGPDSNSKQQAASVQYGSPFAQPVPSEADAVLSQWRGNMAIMAANRVAGEEAAMVKLGDRLWQERSQVCSCKRSTLLVL